MRMGGLKTLPTTLPAQILVNARGIDLDVEDLHPVMMKYW